MYRIAEARVARGWSQQQLAEASGLTQQSIARYESGQRDPQTSAIKALSSALNVTVSYLLGLDSSDTELTDEEKRLIDLYRKADSSGQRSIMAVAETLAATHAPSQSEMKDAG